MEKLAEAFYGNKDIVAVFHKKPASELKEKDIDNYFYVLFKKFPSCGEVNTCTAGLHKILGGNAVARSVNELELQEKDQIFLKYHIVYNAEPVVTQEYVTKTLKAHAAYKAAAEKALSAYKGKYEEKDAFSFYYTLPLIPALLSAAVFIFILLTQKGTQWLFYSGLWAGIFFTVYVVMRLSKVFDKLLPLLYSSDQPGTDNSEYARARKLISAGENVRALRKYRKLVEKYPEKFEPQYQLAQLLEQMQDFRQAVIKYQKAYLKEYREETLAGLLYHMAELQTERLFDKESAKRNLERVVSEFPETEFAKKAKEKMESKESK